MNYMSLGKASHPSVQEFLSFNFIGLLENQKLKCTSCLYAVFLCLQNMVPSSEAAAPRCFNFAEHLNIMSLYAEALESLL
jgi:hypothetical protein